MAGRSETSDEKDHDHRACMIDAMTRARQLCTKREVRLTPIREKVLQIVWRSHKPIGAYEVLNQLSRSHKAARPPTVYRAIDFLKAEGFLHKIESLNAYLGCVEAGAPHTGHFLICRQCGVTEEIADTKIDQALNAAARRTRFLPEQKTVEISGVCAQCTP